MNIDKVFSLIDKDYIIKIRRQLHMKPEIGFDLPNTIALVKKELDLMGIIYTEKYGKSSVVATINNEKGNFTIGLRADMDALPIQEINDVPYKSQYDGIMHACGHDAHTAMLLATAKTLNQIKGELNCRVVFLFQPSEEGPDSGAKYMVTDGVMDNIDIILGMHIENWLESGTVGVCNGMSMASNRPFKIEIFGKSAHATLPHSGIDALAMANRIYSAVQLMLTRELDPFSQWVCSIGTLKSGKAYNVIADYAEMEGTIRTYSNEVDAYIINRIKRIVESVANEIGGKAVVNSELEMYPLYNDPYISNLVIDAAEKIIGKENVVNMKIKMSSEDFSHYLTKKPGVFFRLGTRSAAKGIISLPHNNNFQIDEDALPLGVKVFVQFVTDNMNGLKK